MSQSNKPVIMCFSGLDSTGGAGIQADIETCLSLGAHCCPIVTAITIQDTINSYEAEAVRSSSIISQARAVLQDIPVKAFKVGLVIDKDTILALHTIFSDYPKVPVIIDPVLRAGGGHELVNEELFPHMRNFLMPHAFLALPNTFEATVLTEGADSLEARGMELLSMGCSYALITGTDAATAEIEHHLFGNHQLIETFQCEPLPHQYHGSGCTLASAVACYIAHGSDIVTACRQGQAFTRKTLKTAQRLGMGQLIPNRANH